MVSFSAIFSLIFFFIPTPVYAHFSETDGTMTVTLHVSPHDDPTAGKQAQLYFLFNDASKKFTFAECTCVVSITEAKKQTYKKELSDTPHNNKSIWGINMPYIFPFRNIYHIVLSGTPKKANAFQPFTVSWDFRVDPVHHGIVEEKEEAKGLPDSVILLSALAVAIIGLILFGLFIKKEYKTS